LKEPGDANLKTHSIQQILVIRHIGEFVRDLATGRKEHAIGHFPSIFKVSAFFAQMSQIIHDISLVHGSNTLPSARLCIMECISSDALGCVPRYKLDRLYNAIYDLRRV
jgi:hypothetical protein